MRVLYDTSTASIAMVDWIKTRGNQGTSAHKQPSHLLKYRNPFQQKRDFLISLSHVTQQTTGQAEW